MSKKTQKKPKQMDGIEDTLDWNKSSDGLIPAIIQNAQTGAVLMLGYMNKEALAKTLETEKVTFFSRSKQRLWMKGETSGHVLNLKSIEVDCDQDTILIQATPEGPACHKGTLTCFNDRCADGGASSLSFLTHLTAVIKERRKKEFKGSYVHKMYKRGRLKIAQKVGEEGVELAIAHTAKQKQETVEEAADLLFHVMLLLEQAGFTLADVADVLEQRHK